MIIKKQVQLTHKSYDEKSKLFIYDFMDIESGLSFSVYSTTKLDQYEKLTLYQISDVNFNLALSKVYGDNGMFKLAWKLKGC